MGALSVPLSRLGFGPLAPRLFKDSRGSRNAQLGIRDCTSKRMGSNQRARQAHVIRWVSGGGVGNGGLLALELRNRESRVVRETSRLQQLSRSISPSTSAQNLCPTRDAGPDLNITSVTSSYKSEWKAEILSGHGSDCRDGSSRTLESV
jgi:hypothetical protein